MAEQTPIVPTPNLSENPDMNINIEFVTSPSPPEPPLTPPPDPVPVPVLAPRSSERSSIDSGNESDPHGNESPEGESVIEQGGQPHDDHDDSPDGETHQNETTAAAEADDEPTTPDGEDENPIIDLEEDENGVLKIKSEKELEDVETEFKIWRHVLSQMTSEEREEIALNHIAKNFDLENENRRLKTKNLKLVSENQKLIKKSVSLSNQANRLTKAVKWYKAMKKDTLPSTKTFHSTETQTMRVQISRRFVQTDPPILIQTHSVGIQAPIVNFYGTNEFQTEVYTQTTELDGETSTSKADQGQQTEVTEVRDSSCSPLPMNSEITYETMTMSASVSDQVQGQNQAYAQLQNQPHAHAQTLPISALAHFIPPPKRANPGRSPLLTELLNKRPREIDPITSMTQIVGHIGNENPEPVRKKCRAFLLGRNPELRHLHNVSQNTPEQQKQHAPPAYISPGLGQGQRCPVHNLVRAQQQPVIPQNGFANGQQQQQQRLVRPYQPPPSVQQQQQQILPNSQYGNNIFIQQQQEQQEQQQSDLEFNHSLLLNQDDQKPSSQVLQDYATNYENNGGIAAAPVEMADQQFMPIQDNSNWGNLTQIQPQQQPEKYWIPNGNMHLPQSQPQQSQYGHWVGNVQLQQQQRQHELPSQYNFWNANASNSNNNNFQQNYDGHRPYGCNNVFPMQQQQHQQQHNSRHRNNNYAAALAAAAAQQAANIRTAATNQATTLIGPDGTFYSNAKANFNNLHSFIGQNMDKLIRSRENVTCRATQQQLQQQQLQHQRPPPQYYNYGDSAQGFANGNPNPGVTVTTTIQQQELFNVTPRGQIQGGHQSQGHRQLVHWQGNGGQVQINGWQNNSMPIPTSGAACARGRGRGRGRGQGQRGAIRRNSEIRPRPPSYGSIVVQSSTTVNPTAGTISTVTKEISNIIIPSPPLPPISTIGVNSSNLNLTMPRLPEPTIEIVPIRSVEEPNRPEKDIPPQPSIILVNAREDRGFDVGWTHFLTFHHAPITCYQLFLHIQTSAINTENPMDPIIAHAATEDWVKIGDIPPKFPLPMRISINPRILPDCPGIQGDKVFYFIVRGIDDLNRSGPFSTVASIKVIRPMRSMAAAVGNVNVNSNSDEIKLEYPELDIPTPNDDSCVHF